MSTKAKIPSAATNDQAATGPEAQAPEPVAPQAGSQSLPDEVTVEFDGETLVLHRTKIGLPNTCFKSGAKCEALWFATSGDAARAGKGFCEEVVRELLTEST